jgi:hypothetical protein
MYHARHDWIHHENQMHRRHWVCFQDCNRSFATQSSFLRHLHDSHNAWLEKKQTSLILTLSERPKEETAVDSCPLCPMTLSLSLLYLHIAQHLEQLSLFVLFPYSADDDTQDASDASDQAQDHRSNDANDVMEGNSGGSDSDIVDMTGSPESMPLASEDDPGWDSLFDNNRAQLPLEQPDAIISHLQDQQHGQMQAASTSDTDNRTRSHDRQFFVDYNASMHTLRGGYDQHRRRSDAPEPEESSYL